MTENSIFRYLCPTLIPEDGLREELRRRNFNVKILDRKNKDELTQIFIKYLTPLPQRSFPNNFRGKLINQMIQVENRHSRRNSKAEDKKSTVQYGFTDSNKRQSSSSLFGGHSSIHHERLRPPIDSSHIQNKTISLGNASSLSSSSLDKVVIIDRSKLQHVSNKTDNTTPNSSLEVDERKPELKRTLSSEKLEDNASSPKKARQRIAWP